MAKEDKNEKHYTVNRAHISHMILRKLIQPLT